MFSSDCSAGTGRVIEPPGDARANVPQGADGGCVEVGAALARARGHAGRGARGRSSGPARDGHAGLPVGPLVTERGDPGPGGPVPGAPDPPLCTVFLCGLSAGTGMRNRVICVGFPKARMPWMVAAARWHKYVGDARADQVTTSTASGRSARWHAAYSAVWPAAAPKPADHSFGVGGEPAADTGSDVGIMFDGQLVDCGKPPA